MEVGGGIDTGGRGLGEYCNNVTSNIVHMLFAKDLLHLFTIIHRSILHINLFSSSTFAPSSSTLNFVVYCVSVQSFDDYVYRKVCVCVWKGKSIVDILCAQEIPPLRFELGLRHTIYTWNRSRRTVTTTTTMSAYARHTDVNDYIRDGTARVFVYECGYGWNDSREEDEEF